MEKKSCCVKNDEYMVIGRYLELRPGTVSLSVAVHTTVHMLRDVNETEFTILRKYFDRVNIVRNNVAFGAMQMIYAVKHYYLTGPASKLKPLEVVVRSVLAELSKK